MTRNTFGELDEFAVNQTLTLKQTMPKWRKLVGQKLCNKSKAKRLMTYRGVSRSSMRK